MFLAVTFPAYLESAIAWRAGVMVSGDVFSPPAYQGVVHDILQFMASNNFLTDHNVSQHISPSTTCRILSSRSG